MKSYLHYRRRAWAREYAHIIGWAPALGGAVIAFALVFTIFGG